MVNIFKLECGPLKKFYLIKNYRTLMDNNIGQHLRKQITFKINKIYNWSQLI